MKLNPIETAISDFLMENVFAGRGLRALEPDDSLFKLGVLDSMAVARTVTFCEQHFSIAIPDQEVLPEHFENVRAIARLVQRLMSMAA